MSTLSPAVLKLMSSANHGDAALTSAALAEGADVNARDLGSNTALIRASGNGFLDVVNILLAHQADTNLTDPEGISALMAAAENGHLEIIKQLLAHGAQVNLAEKRGSTALCWSVGRADLDAVRTLLAAGGTFDVRHVRLREEGAKQLMTPNSPLKNVLDEHRKRTGAKFGTRAEFDLATLLATETDRDTVVSEVAKALEKASIHNVEESNFSTVYRFIKRLMYDGLYSAVSPIDVTDTIICLRKVGAAEAADILEGIVRKICGGNLPSGHDWCRNFEYKDLTHQLDRVDDLLTKQGGAIYTALYDFLVRNKTSIGNPNA